MREKRNTKIDQLIKEYKYLGKKLDPIIKNLPRKRLDREPKIQQERINLIVKEAANRDVFLSKDRILIIDYMIFISGVYAIGGEYSQKVFSKVDQGHLPPKINEELRQKYETFYRWAEQSCPAYFSYMKERYWDMLTDEIDKHPGLLDEAAEFMTKEWIDNKEKSPSLLVYKTCVHIYNILYPSKK